MKFNIGDIVTKVTGDYHLIGTVVSAFKKLDGTDRFIVEVHVVPGLLLIFNEKQLEKIES